MKIEKNIIRIEKRRLSKLEKKKVRELYIQGWSIEHVSKTMKVERSIVIQAIKKVLK